MKQGTYAQQMRSSFTGSTVCGSFLTFTVYPADNEPEMLSLELRPQLRAVHRASGALVHRWAPLSLFHSRTTCFQGQTDAAQ